MILRGQVRCWPWRPVNSNVVGVTTSLPLKEFAKGLPRGTGAKCFEQRLEGDWEQSGR